MPAEMFPQANQVKKKQETLVDQVAEGGSPGVRDKNTDWDALKAGKQGQSVQQHEVQESLPHWGSDGRWKQVGKEKTGRNWRKNTKWK